MNPGTSDTPEALAAQHRAAAQLRDILDARAEGMSILNYNMANKQYLDALNVGKLLGVDTSRLRPYGGESRNTVNVIGTDAMDSLARRLAAVEHLSQPQPAVQQPPANTTDGQTKTGGTASLLKKLALGTALVLTGAAIPYVAERVNSAKTAEPPKQKAPADTAETKVPWNQPPADGEGRVEVDVY